MLMCTVLDTTTRPRSNPGPRVSIREGEQISRLRPADAPGHMLHACVASSSACRPEWSTMIDDRAIPGRLGDLRHCPAGVLQTSVAAYAG